MQNLRILRSNFFVSITRKKYVIVIFIFRLIVSTIIVLLKLIVNIFTKSALNQNNDAAQNFYFICHKINYFVINYFNNLIKNICVNEIELKNLNDKNSKNV